MVTDANGLVTLPEVAERAGLDVQVLRRAAKEGLVTPAPVRKAHGTKTFTVDDALFILTVAALAAAAGVLFVTLLRAIKTNGGTLDGGAIKIPLPKMNT